MKAWNARTRKRDVAAMVRGRRLSVAPLLERFEGNASDLARAAGVNASAVTRWKERGLSLAQADDIAVRLGLHPMEVWPDFYDDEAA